MTGINNEAIDGSGKTPLTVMGQALLEAERKSNRKGNNMTEYRGKIAIGAGLTALTMKAHKDNTLRGFRLILHGWEQDSAGRLYITFKVRPDGKHWAWSSRDADHYQWQQSWAGAPTIFKQLPHFGRLLASYVLDGDTVVVTVGADRPGVRVREITKSKKQPIGHANVNEPSRADFAAAVRTVNSYKNSLGDALRLSLNGDGALRAEVVESFS